MPGAVDGVVDGLAHPHVVERRLGGLHAQRGGLVVLERHTEVAGAVLGSERGGDVGLVVGDHRRADAALAAPLVLGAGERRLRAPVGVVALQEQLLAVLPVLDGVGAGADRLAHLLGGAGGPRHDLDERDTQRQNRIRLLGADDQGVVVGCRQLRASRRRTRSRRRCSCRSELTARSMENAASSAVNGAPSENFTPSRMSNVHSVGRGLTPAGGQQRLQVAACWGRARSAVR